MSAFASMVSNVFIRDFFHPIPKTELGKFEVEFDRLNEEESHYRNRNDICTPMGCVKEMVDSIPQSFWRRENIEVLDPCAGNGNFHAYIKQFVPMNRLIFNEINEERIGNIGRLFGSEAIITRKDFLQYDENKKFDLIVSNPPYALFDKEGNRASKNHNLSRSFINKSLRLTKPNGMLLFIVPNNWMSFSDRNTLPYQLSSYQFLHVNIHGAKKWFPKIGSTFTWFLLKKEDNKNPFTIENNYIWKNTAKATLRKGVNYIPLYYNNVVDSIFNKTVDANNEKQGIDTNSYLHRHTKSCLLQEKCSSRYPYKVIHTPSRTVWSKRPHRLQNGWKVFVSLTDRYKTFIDNCGMTQSIAYILCGSEKEATQRKKELDNPLFRFLNDMTRYGNFNNNRILQRLPRLANVKLTEEENELVMDYWSNHVKNK